MWKSLIKKEKESKNVERYVNHMKKALIKVNGLYYKSKLATGSIEWSYSKDEAQVIEGFDIIQETITSITETLEENNQNIDIELVSPDQKENSFSITGELKGAEIIY
jgi:hypothetical protein